MYRRLLAAPLVLAVLATAAAFAFLTLRETQRNVASRRDLQARLNLLAQLQQSLTDAETGQRGFLLTGDAAYLGPFHSGLQRAESAVAGLRGQPELYAALEGPTARKIAELGLTVRLRQEGHGDEALALVRTDDGRRVMDQIRARCAPALAATEAEHERLLQRLQTLALRTFAAVALALLLGAASFAFALVEARRRRATQRVLKWQEARFRNLADHAPVGIFETDPRGVSLYRNAALRALFGFTAEDPKEDPWEPLIHPDDLPILSGAFRSALATVTPFEAEYRICRSGHPERWVRVEGRPSYGPGGQHLGFLGTVVDIHAARTQVQAAEAALEAHHRAFFELATTGLALADLTHRRFFAANEALCRLLGYGADELAQLDLLDLTHPEDRARTEVALRQALDGEIPGDRYEKRYRRKDGSWVWVDLSFALMRRDEDGSLIAATIAVDITDRKAIEAQFRALNAELETRVAQRTRELTEANRELEAFSYSVSHDLRAPLRHLDGFAGLLERHLGGGADDKTRHYLHRIGDAARTMGVLIDDLLAFSRMSRQELRTSTVDLDALLQGLAGECPSEVVWSVEPLGRVKGDVSMLRQAFQNLLNNAVKFSRDRRPPTVTIRREGHREGRHIFCVEDNGVGFDMAYRDKLFGVFQRLHPESTFEGTGIGLAIVARVVHRHGGEVWAESAPGQGARFYLSLPAHDQGEAA